MIEVGEYVDEVDELETIGVEFEVVVIVDCFVTDMVGFDTTEDDVTAVDCIDFVFDVTGVGFDIIVDDDDDEVVVIDGVDTVDGCDTVVVVDEVVVVVDFSL
jgi:hypothetical protein